MRTPLAVSGRATRPPMLFWTIQPPSVLRQVEANGCVLVAPRPSDGVPCSYRWLCARLYRRIEGYRGRLPWWFYCEKPDIRYHRHIWPKSLRLVRLELDINSGLVVSFPCWAWHLVYCGQYLARSPEEFRRWRASLSRARVDEDTWPLPEPWKTRLERSWDRLFERLPDQPWPHYQRLVGDPIPGREAVSEAILASQIRRVTFFEGASNDPAMRLFFERWKKQQPFAE